MSNRRCQHGSFHRATATLLERFRGDNAASGDIVVDLACRARVLLYSRPAYLHR